MDRSYAASKLAACPDCLLVFGGLVRHFVPAHLTPDGAGFGLTADLVCCALFGVLLRSTVGRPASWSPRQPTGLDSLATQAGQLSGQQPGFVASQLAAELRSLRLLRCFILTGCSVLTTRQVLCRNSCAVPTDQGSLRDDGFALRDPAY